MRAETILGFIEVDVDYHMALLWCAMAECAQDPVKALPKARAVRQWFKLKGFHPAALITWLYVHGLEDFLGTLVLQVQSHSLSLPPTLFPPPPSLPPPLRLPLAFFLTVSLPPDPPSLPPSPPSESLAPSPTPTHHPALSLSLPLFLSASRHL